MPAKPPLPPLPDLPKTVAEQLPIRDPADRYKSGKKVRFTFTNDRHEDVIAALTYPSPAVAIQFKDGTWIDVMGVWHEPARVLGLEATYVIIDELPFTESQTIRGQRTHAAILDEAAWSPPQRPLWLIRLRRFLGLRA